MEKTRFLPGGGLVDLRRAWQRSAVHSECTFHQLSPYMGKLKSSIAEALVRSFSPEGGTVFDPFCGSGTVALEAWIQGRNVIATDLSPYAAVLTRGKLAPPGSVTSALDAMAALRDQVRRNKRDIDFSSIPMWVKQFFHQDTLIEAVSWSEALREAKQWFLLACLMGILHHQRPGFLSYPASHAVPYLRKRKYPRESFPKLYEYRAVPERLEKKVIRSFKRVPLMDYGLAREFHLTSAASFRPERSIDCIITSPPYMSRLDYARDNHLRMWFLGTKDPVNLDRKISPNEERFIKLMHDCLLTWKAALREGGYCVLVLGDMRRGSRMVSIPGAVEAIATDDVGGYRKVCLIGDDVPGDRRIRRELRDPWNEAVLVLRLEEENARERQD